MDAATSQDYHPEWIITGYQYQDWDGYGRGMTSRRWRTRRGRHPARARARAPSPALPVVLGRPPRQLRAHRSRPSVSCTRRCTTGPDADRRQRKKGFFAAPAPGRRRRHHDLPGRLRPHRPPALRRVRIAGDRPRRGGIPTSRVARTQSGRSWQGPLYLNGAKRYAYGQFPTVPLLRRIRLGRRDSTSSGASRRCASRSEPVPRLPGQRRSGAA
jgi:hypothetical protein